MVPAPVGGHGAVSKPVCQSCRKAMHACPAPSCLNVAGCAILLCKVIDMTHKNRKCDSGLIYFNCFCAVRPVLLGVGVTIWRQVVIVGLATFVHALGLPWHLLLPHGPFRHKCYIFWKCIRGTVTHDCGNFAPEYPLYNNVR